MGTAYHCAMRTRSAAAFALLLGVTAMQKAPVQQPALAAPGSTLSAVRLARIDKVFQQYVDENRIGGAVGLVLQDGKVVYEGAAGWADKEAGRKMAPDTIFRIASQTKALTSEAILSVMEEGKP
jgi:CubicO group peptidase (beta-lactamase class C family)